MGSEAFSFRIEFPLNSASLPETTRFASKHCSAKQSNASQLAFVAYIGEEELNLAHIDDFEDDCRRQLIIYASTHRSDVPMEVSDLCKSRASEHRHDINVQQYGTSCLSESHLAHPQFMFLDNIAHNELEIDL